MGTPLAGYDADVWVTATPSVALAAPESATDSGDHTTYIAATHALWDKTQPFTVQTSPNGTTWTTATNYVMQWATGKIVFTSAQAAGTQVRINAGSYFVATQLDGCHDWSLSLKAATVKTTAFQAAGRWETKTATIFSGSGQVVAYRTDDRLSKELNNALAFILYFDKSANYRWQFFGYITDVSPKNDASNINEQTISFTVDSVPYYLIV